MITTHLLDYSIAGLEHLTPYERENYQAALEAFHTLVEEKNKSRDLFIKHHGVRPERNAASDLLMIGFDEVIMEIYEVERNKFISESLDNVPGVSRLNEDEFNTVVENLGETFDNCSRSEWFYFEDDIIDIIETADLCVARIYSYEPRGWDGNKRTGSVLYEIINSPQGNVISDRFIRSEDDPPREDYFDEIFDRWRQTW